VLYFHLRVKTRIEPPMTPPNAELTPSPLQIHQVNLVPVDREAEPSLLFDLTVKKRKGKGKEKAQSPRWFEHLPPPGRNVCIYLLSTYSRKLIIAQGGGTQPTPMPLSNYGSGDESPRCNGPTRSHIVSSLSYS
jgi:hypothetical protein